MININAYIDYDYTFYSYQSNPDGFFLLILYIRFINSKVINMSTSTMMSIEYKRRLIVYLILSVKPTCNSYSIISGNNTNHTLNILYTLLNTINARITIMCRFIIINYHSLSRLEREPYRCPPETHIPEGHNT